jgi:hypothetical protein
MSDSKRPVALNVNMDSMRECMKLMGMDPKTLAADPSFFGVMDRFISIASEYGAKLTIFVIGKDLEDERNFDQVRKWSKLGHEIGNHTYSHHQSFGQLDSSGIRSEIRKAHDLIERCTGRAPVGFVAPAWSYSPLQIKELRSLGYLYDTSLFPSYLMPLIQLMLKMRSKLPDTDIPLLRKDLPGSLIGSHTPFIASVNSPWRGNRSSGEGVLMMPLPTAMMRLPIWHTLAFCLPESIFMLLLRSSIRRNKYFYYLMHPADLTCIKSDLKNISSMSGVERMSVEIGVKEEKLKRVLDVVAEHGRFVTMRELAEAALDEHTKKLHRVS